jgi:hypothetical protein
MMSWKSASKRANIHVMRLHLLDMRTEILSMVLVFLFSVFVSHDQVSKPDKVPLRRLLHK